MHRYLVSLILPVLCLTMALGGQAIAGHHDPGYRVACFPASQWDGPAANPEDRPCTVVGVPEEDGSNYVLQQTAADEVGVCILPNPYEERGEYVAQCHRVPSRFH